ncbi:hypothetical protein BDK51DRAFT_27955, partial [Blyttiomyces helicus]
MDRDSDTRQDAEDPLLGGPRQGDVRSSTPSFWAPWERKGSEKWLVAVIVSLLILTLVFGGLYASTSSVRPPSHRERVYKADVPCNTPDCVITAARVLKAMNRSADPCEDFYQYACGGWQQDHPIPDDKSQVGSFISLTETNLHIMKDIYESPYEREPSYSEKVTKVDQSNFAKAKGLYESCT